MSYSPSTRTILIKYHHSSVEYCSTCSKFEQSEVLDGLDADTVIKELNCLVPNVNDRDIALICYEKPSDFCHRHLVSEWLNQNGFKCEEWRNIKC